MTKPSAATAYSREQAEVYDDRRFTDPAGKRIHRVELDHLLWALNRVPASARVLEVGCGTGRLLVDARRAGYRVDGADASPDMLDMLKRKIHQESNDQIELIQAEAAKLPIPDDSYDAVYAIRLLNQTESPEYALHVIEEMIRITRPGGYTLAEFSNHYRPRLGTAARRSTTRLRPANAKARGCGAGAELIGFRGAFLSGIQTYRFVPIFLLGIVDAFDRMLSRVFPRLCARTYVLFRKASAP